MDDGARMLLAYAIIGALLLVGIPFAIIRLRRRSRRKLRRRGDKRFGH